MSRRYRLEYLPVAQEDLVEIFDYIRQDDPEVAGEFIDRMDKAISRLSVYPKSGTVPKDDRLQMMGYRMLVVDNYLVFYVFDGKVVEVRRILHGSRRYGFLLE